MKILIVDDSLTTRSETMQCLRKAGFDPHDILEVSSATEALREISANPPHLLLCDFHMPGISGMALLDAVRKKPIKFVFVTSERSEAIHQKAIAAGAHAVIVKPFTFESLARALSSSTPTIIGG